MSANYMTLLERVTREVTDYIEREARQRLFAHAGEVAHESCVVADVGSARLGTHPASWRVLIGATLDVNGNNQCVSGSGDTIAEALENFAADLTRKGVQRG